MNILVTGGSGFIGSHLVKKLVSLGHEVTVFDRGHKAVPNAKVIEGDIRDAGDVQRAMKGMEAVFHLAAISDSRADDDAVYQVNFIGSKNVFEAAKAADAKIIFTSSAAVYGDTKLAREADECRPLSQYGKSKLRAEKICPPNACVFRLFNVYGPGGNSVVNRFCRLIPKYEPVAIYGRGTQTRDFIHVDDVVNALALGLELSGTYNIGTGKETSLLELIDIVHEMTKSKPDIKFERPVPGDIARSRADITKISATTWYPRVELLDGVEQTLKAEGFDFSIVEHVR